MKKPLQAMTLEWYSSTARQLVLALQQDTKASIALCSIPVLGEDLDALSNHGVENYSGTQKG